MTEALIATSKEVYLDFSGYIKLDPETKLQYTGDNSEVSQIITVKEWLGLSQKMRDEYILENFENAIREGEDLEFEDLILSDE